MIVVCRQVSKFVTVLVLISTQAVDAQEETAGGTSILQMSSPRSTVQFSADGTLRTWVTETENGRFLEVVDDSERRILGLSVQVGRTGTMDEIVWQTSTTSADGGLEFIGLHEASGLRVSRSYSWAADDAALLSSISFDWPDGAIPTELRCVLTIPNGLIRHTQNDRSLGDYFYGYRRTSFSSSGETVRPYSDATEIRAETVAFVSRHSGMLVRQVTPGDPMFRLQPNSPVTLDYDSSVDGRSDYEFAYTLSARSLSLSSVADTDFEDLLYTDLAGPIASLARLIERILQSAYSLFGSLGIAIVGFALAVRIVFLPISIWAIRQQRAFSRVQEAMAPKLKEINATLKGAEKSERTIELYKEHRISPFTGLKGSTSLFIQLPILVAFFGVTTESALFRDVSFLWISDLSLPDQILRLPFTIPGIGGYINLLPLVLGVISVLASKVLQSSSPTSAAKFNRGAMFMVLLIVVFFYSFASALVLYWTIVNIAQILEARYAAQAN